jgi:putative autoinducer-2 (AI-2) aldolase
MKRGAIGVTFGRNIWQDNYPVGMARALQAVIHKNTTPDEAHELYVNIGSEKK